MKFCKSVDGRVVATIDGGSISAPEGYESAPPDLDIGWMPAGDGTYSPPPPQLKTIYTHREFAVRLAHLHVPIQRLRDENDKLPPDQKNYELSRLFLLWDLSHEIDLHDPDLHAAFTAFVALGLITADDARSILTPNEEA